MFGRNDVYSKVNAFGVRVKDEREKDLNHLVEVTFEAPLSYELMDEISPAIAKDLFDKVRGEWVPKPELNGVDLNLAPAAQVMTVKSHPELDPEIRIGNVSLRKVKAKKADAGSWVLAFTASWTLGDDKEAIVLLRKLKQGIYLTMAEQQPTLDMDDAPAGDGSTATVDGGGNVTSIRRGRGRPRKSAPVQDTLAEGEPSEGVDDHDTTH